MRNVKHILILAALLALVVLSPAGAADEAKGPGRTAKIAVLPFNINATGDVDYLKRAVVDILSSRIGAIQTVELEKTHAVIEALGGTAPGDITDKIAEDVGEKLGADYVLYGSLSLLGESLSLDVKLVDVKQGSITPFFSRGAGIDSVVDMAERVASMVLPPVAGVEAGEVEFPAPVGSSYTGKFPTPKVEKEEAVAVEEKLEEKPKVVAKKPEKEDKFIITPGAPLEGERDILWKTGVMKGVFKGFRAIDLDSDGRKELVLIDKRNITISRIEAGELKVLKEIKGDRHVELLYVSTSGGDGSGPPVVYISGLRAGNPNSKILEYKDNDFKITASGIPWLLRAVHIQGEEPKLFGQRFRITEGFYGKKRVLKRDGAKVKNVGAAALPLRVGLYDFELFDLTGDGQVELVELDEHFRLRIYRKEGGVWDEMWKAEGRYGGSLNYVDLEEIAITPAETEFVIIKGMFLHADLDGDGRMEIIIKRGQAGGLLGSLAARVPFFKRSEITSISWTSDTGYGVGFKENWKTKSVSGHIADFTIDDLDGDGTPELTMLVVEGMKMFKVKPRSYLLSLSLF